MTKEELKEAIESLLGDAEEQNEWGGSETSNGALMPGKVDWKQLRAGILKAVDSLANPTGQEPEGLPAQDCSNKNKDQ